MDGQDQEPEDKAEATQEHEPEKPTRSTADYEKYQVEPQTVNPLWGWLFKGILILLLLGGIAYATNWYLKNHKSNSPAKNNQSAQSNQVANKIDSTTKHYSSPNFYLSFDYPSNWTISDDGGGVMTATSPNTQLTDAAGQSVNGKIVLTIRKKTEKLKEFTAGNAIAAKKSVKITYSQPSQTQRGATYISFLRYASTSASSGLDGIYITGDAGYKVDQAIPKADITPIDPVISITFLGSTGQSLTIDAGSWDNASFADPLQKMLESLSIT